MLVRVPLRAHVIRRFVEVNELPDGKARGIHHLRGPRPFHPRSGETRGPSGRGRSQLLLIRHAAVPGHVGHAVARVRPQRGANHDQGMLNPAGDQVRGVGTFPPQHDAARQVQCARNLKGAGRQRHHPTDAVSHRRGARGVQRALNPGARVVCSVAVGRRRDRGVDPRVVRETPGDPRVPGGDARGRQRVNRPVILLCDGRRSAQGAAARHRDQTCGRQPQAPSEVGWFHLRCDSRGP